MQNINIFRSETCEKLEIVSINFSSFQGKD